jgi:hypothetical protein
MKPLVLLLASAAGSAMTAICAQGAALQRNSICSKSAADEIMAINLLSQGDKKAFQILVEQGRICNLNDVEIEVTDVLGSGLVAIRVVGTLDLYYTSFGNIVKSGADKAVDAARASQAEQDDEAAELAREARFDKAAHAPPTPPSPYEILDAAYKEFNKAYANLTSARKTDPQGVLATSQEDKLNYDAAVAAVSKAEHDYWNLP